MIRINLLGKKKVANVPFGLDEHLEKLGVSAADFDDFRPILLRLVVLGAGLYVANFVPAYLHTEKITRLDAEVAKLTQRSGELQKELVSKKDIRKQMEQLNKEETELQSQLSAVNALQQGRGLAFKTLNDLMVQIGNVGKVWLEDLRYERTRVTLNGKSWEYFAVNEFVKSIGESTHYSNVLFKEISTESPRFKLVPGVPESMQKIKRFGLDFTVKETE